MSRLALKRWSPEAIVLSLQLAMMLGFYKAANDNGEARRDPS